MPLRPKQHVTHWCAIIFCVERTKEQLVLRFLILTNLLPASVISLLFAGEGSTVHTSTSTSRTLVQTGRKILDLLHFLLCLTELMLQVVTLILGIAQ
jgi:hypothetical protein